MNLPIMVTLLRIGFIPIICSIIFCYPQSKLWCYSAALLFALAFLLDFLDGYLARKMDLVSDLGKFLDPLADKLLYLSVLVTLVALTPSRVPLFVVLIVLIRELTVTGIRAMAASKGVVIAAGGLGKIKTVFSAIGGIFLIAFYAIPLGPITIDTYTIGLMLTYLATLLCIISGYQYFKTFINILKG